MFIKRSKKITSRLRLPLELLDNNKDDNNNDNKNDYNDNNDSNNDNSNNSTDNEMIIIFAIITKKIKLKLR